MLSAMRLDDALYGSNYVRAIDVNTLIAIRGDAEGAQDVGTVK